MFIDRIKYAITVKASFLIFLVTLFATIIRPLFIDQDVVFTYIGIVNSIALGTVFFYIKFSGSKHFHPFFFVTIGLLTLTPTAFVSGGVNSQFAFIFPIIPIFIALISSPKYTWATTIIILLIIGALLLTVELAPNYTYENVPIDKTQSRALWLCLSVLLSAKFGIEFNRINSALGNKLSEQAEIDMLTGIANRRSAIAFLTAALEETKLSGKWLAVMVIDLDHFKLINDTYGHLAGDLCLQSVAQSIENNLRRDTDLAGRYGGEEFIAVVKDVDENVVRDIAEKIRLAIEASPVQIDSGDTITLTSTIGVAIDDGSNLSTTEQFIDSADKALYAGKDTGRNCVVMATGK